MTPPPTLAEALLVLCRAAVLIPALMLWGAGLFRLRLMPGAPPLRGGLALAMLLVAGVAASLPLRVAQMSGAWSGLCDGTTLWVVLTGTGVGQGWMAQMLAAPVLALAAWRGRLWLGIAAAAGVLAAQSLGGHAAAAPGWAGIARRGLDVVHLLAAGAWLGALPLVLRLLPDLHRPEARRILIRYSGEGHAWVALALLSGLAASVQVVGEDGLNPGSAYQQLLALKIALVAAMVGLALRNRYVLVPRLAHDPAAAGAIARATRGEIALGLGAVALVACFGMLDPA